MNGLATPLTESDATMKRVMRSLLPSIVRTNPNRCSAPDRNRGSLASLRHHGREQARTRLAPTGPFAAAASGRRGQRDWSDHLDGSERRAERCHESHRATPRDPMGSAQSSHAVGIQCELHRSNRPLFESVTRYSPRSFVTLRLSTALDESSRRTTAPVIGW